MKFCNKCLSPIEEKNDFTLKLIKNEIENDTRDWVLGYSGGKDSSVLLALTLESIRKYNLDKKLRLVYCDTGVEIPLISSYVHKTLKTLKKECSELNIDLEVNIAKPIIDDRFFVKVIGRGYPTPTNKFRWCTDRLRINPIKQIINPEDEITLLLGVRRGESIERDRTIKKHATEDYFRYKQVGNSKISIFSPIVDYSTREIWETLKFKEFPKSIDFQTLGTLYKDAGAECPIIKDPNGSPCGQGRFGCWTCTVVRKDKAVTSLVNEGYHELGPLLNFRNWLAVARDNPDYRCHLRRNKQKGPGPMTLKARKLILKKLKEAEKQSGISLIETAEIKRIKELWVKDENSVNYQLIEKSL